MKKCGGCSFSSMSYDSKVGSCSHCGNRFGRLNQPFIAKCDKCLNDYLIYTRSVSNRYTSEPAPQRRGGIVRHGTNSIHSVPVTTNNTLSDRMVHIQKKNVEVLEPYPQLPSSPAAITTHNQASINTWKALDLDKLRHMPTPYPPSVTTSSKSSVSSSSGTARSFSDASGSISAGCHINVIKPIMFRPKSINPVMINTMVDGMDVDNGSDYDDSDGGASDSVKNDDFSNCPVDAL